MPDRFNFTPAKHRMIRFLWPTGILATLLILLLVTSPWNSAEAEKTAPAGPPAGLPVEAIEVRVRPR